MVRQTKLNEWEVLVGHSLLGELERKVDLLPQLNLSDKELDDMVRYMEDIKIKMRKHISLHKQWEVTEQYLKFDEIIKYVRDLQNKRDVTSM